MPNRILKESICTSDSLDRVGLFCETFFYRLIVNCDDYGRMDARPKILRARLFPLRELRDEEIEEALAKLSEMGCVERYESEGKPFLRLPSWEKHQQIRAKRSKFPPPPEAADKAAKITPRGAGQAQPGGDIDIMRRQLESQRENPSSEVKYYGKCI